MRVVKFNFIGQSNLITFARNKKGDNDDDEYVNMDFKGKGGVGKAKLKLPSVKQDMAVVGGLGGVLGAGAAYNKGWKTKLASATLGAGLGAGTAYLLRKRTKDMNGRSDKGKKRKY